MVDANRQATAIAIQKDLAESVAESVAVLKTAVDWANTQLNPQDRSVNEQEALVGLRALYDAQELLKIAIEKTTAHLKEGQQYGWLIKRISQ